MNSNQNPLGATKRNVNGSFLLAGTLVQPSLNLIGEEQVEPKAMQVLEHLMAAQPNPVSVKALLDAVWAESVVIENVVHQAIARLRRVLGDRSGAPQFIKTVPRQGYQLIADVSAADAAELAAAGAATAEPAQFASKPKRLRSKVLGLAALVFACVAFAGYYFYSTVLSMQMPQAASVYLKSLAYDDGDRPAELLALAINQDIRDQLAESRLSLIDEAGSPNDGDYVVEGLLRRVDSGWRISVELRESKNGRVVWLESTDLPEDTQQFNRAAYVAKYIEAATATNNMTKWLPAKDPKTKEHFFAASMEWNKLLFGDNGNWQVAINHLERTTQLEEEFLPGHMMLAAIYSNRLGGEMSAREALPHAQQHAEQVLAIEPQETYIRGQVLVDLELAYDAARNYLEAAKQTQIPLGVIEEQLCKVEFVRGSFDKAIDHCRTALQMGGSPDQVSTLRFSAWALSAAERYSEALAHYAQASDTGAGALIVTGSIWQAALVDQLYAVQVLVQMGDRAAAIERITPLLASRTTTAFPEVFVAALAMLDREDEARTLLKGAEQRHIAGGHVDNSAMFFGYHYLGDSAGAAPWLMRLVKNREWWAIGQLRAQRLQSSIKSQPRYAAALQELADIEKAAAQFPLLGAAVH